MYRPSSRTELRSERYKQFSVSKTRPAADLVFQSNPICPRHPGSLREVIRRLAAASSTGISAPPRFSPSCPHLLRRFFHARLYGRTGVSDPIAGFRRAGSQIPVRGTRRFQPAVSRFSPERTNRGPDFKKMASRCFRPADHSAAADVAHAFGKAIGKVPDEWVFNFQRTSHSLLSRKWVKGFHPFTL